MNTYNRGTIFSALLLIGMGVIFLILNIAGITLSQTWPIIFFALAAAFYLPPLLWPSARAGLAGLCIPGGILLSLGCIFLYNSLSGDWNIWAYAWILINAGVGFGLITASWIGRWGSGVSSVGWWMFLASILTFSIFAAIFGTPAVKFIAPAALIGFGIWLVFRTLRR